jgi:short-subunit dehydrogenase
VTGASSGIGEECARQLATDGTALVLVARRKDRLEALADSVDVPAEVLVADLSTEADRELVAKRLEAEVDPVDLLIANAGVSTPRQRVATGRWEDAKAMIDINVVGVARLVYAAAAVFSGRKTGGILVTSSTAGFQPIATSTTYAATKAFVTHFTEAVHEELGSSGVHVTALCPGPTRTEMVGDDTPDRVPSWARMEADEVAAAGLEGVARNRAVVVPGLPNQVGAVAASLAPRGVTRRVAGALFGRYTED